MSFRGPVRVAPPTTHSFDELLKHPNTSLIVNVERGELPEMCDDTGSRAGLRSYGKNLLRRAKSKVQDKWAQMKEAIRNQNMSAVKRLVTSGFDLLEMHEHKGESMRALEYSSWKLGAGHAITTFLSKKTRSSMRG
jgi:hypothetical protein